MSRWLGGAGRTLLLCVALITVAAPWLAPNAPDRRFNQLLYAPPTWPHAFTAHAPGVHVHRLRVVSRIERRFAIDDTRVVPLRWFSGGKLLDADPDAGAPLLLLGADGYGRDIFSRLLYGARITLALAVCAALAAIAIGSLIGATAGYAGGRLDLLLSRTSELVLVLPAIYVALALRAALPLILPVSQVFVLLTGIFGFLGWPIVSRGVRAIVAAERQQEYILAARALGATPGRILFRHLLPAAVGYLITQATLLLPAFILAEATLSYVGLGFPDTVPTWGTMLQDAANVATLGDNPWPLAPAAAIFIVGLAVNAAVQGRGRPPVQLGG